MNENHVQVLLYTSYLHIIGGIETFVLNFIDLLEPYYDIGVYCPSIPPEMRVKMAKKIRVFQRPDNVVCDTLIMIRIMEPIPSNITYQKSIRMCHACKSTPSWYIKQDCDKVVHVSKASKKSFESDGTVIYNPLTKSDKKALIFVSATRIPAKDKGENTDRMIKLAKMLNNKQIPFIWFNFSDVPLNNAPQGVVNVGTNNDIQPFIARADYLVQLSDQEGFGYSVLEALINNTAVICTPFETTKELGVVDGKNGYIIPFNMDFDVTKLWNVPVFTYTYDNESILKKWRKLLGNTTPKHDYMYEDKEVCVKVVQDYKDIVLNRFIPAGTIVTMSKDRAKYIQELGYVNIVGG